MARLRTNLYAWFTSATVIGALCGVVPAQDIASPAPAAPATAPAGSARTLINLSRDNMGPQDAFNEIARQAGIKFTTQGNLWDQDALLEPITVDFKDRPFWSVVRELCTDLNLQPQMNYGMNNGSRRVMLMQTGNGPKMRRWTELPSVETDGFLVQAQSFNRQQSINYQNPEQAQDYCTVQLMTYVDPAIRVSSFSGSAKIDEAVDDNGNSLLPDGKNRMSYGSNNQRSLVYNVAAVLKYPDKNPGKKIAKLRCTLTLRGGDKMDTLAVEKPLEAAETTKEFGDLTVTFYSLKKTGGTNGQPAQYALKLGFKRDDDDRGGNDFWSLIQSAQLLDAKGRQLGNSGGGGGNNNVFTTNYSTRGDEGDGAPGEPVRWVLELPTGTKTIRVPVEFKDLPMP